MVANKVSRSSIEWIGSARRCVAITPDASAALPEISRAIVSNDGGAVACRFEGDDADVTLTLLAGVVYPYNIEYVRISGTDATEIFALY